MTMIHEDTSGMGISLNTRTRSSMTMIHEDTSGMGAGRHQFIMTPVAYSMTSIYNDPSGMGMSLNSSTSSMTMIHDNISSTEQYDNDS